MEVKDKYSGLVERQAKISLREGQGLRMLHDDFESDWKRGDEPHGTLTFSDEPTAAFPKPRDLAAEIDNLKTRVAGLEGKISKQ